jgi:DNA-binding SARP family transcriptional activator
MSHHPRVSAPRFEARLLGRFAVVRDGEEIPAAAFGGRLRRRLVRMLASRPGAFSPKDALVEALWPERVRSCRRSY